MISPIAALRVYRAWHKLSPEQRDEFRGSMETAHAATVEVVHDQRPTPRQGIRHEMMLAHAVTHPSQEFGTLLRHFWAWFRQVVLRRKPYVDDEGNVWGFQKWEQMDAGWLEALAALWENLASHKGAFAFGQDVPPVIQIPRDTLHVAVVGDWGTGEWGIDGARCPSQKVMAAIRAHQPDLVIHLGDTYYAGSDSEVTSNLMKLWQPGSLGSLALNGNHEMYPGGFHYHDVVLQSDTFKLQGGRSYFCIETNTHVLLGLDSSYYADPGKQYLHGKLWKDDNDLQASPQWGLIRQAATLRKPIILMTHHNPICEDGTLDPATPLMQQLITAFEGTGTFPETWYYGHVHMAALYAGRWQEGVPHIRYGCIGHGALPWSHAEDLLKGHEGGYVEWYEDKMVPGRLYDRAKNGFAILELSVGGTDERIYDEDGLQSYPVSAATPSLAETAAPAYT